MEQSSLLPLGKFTEREAGQPLMPDEVRRIEAAALSAFGDLRARWMRGELPEDNMSLDEMGWMALYPMVLKERPANEKSRWRKAAYVAWEAWPGERWPRTKEEFARKIGLRSSRQLYIWRSKDRTISEQIEVLWQALMSDEVRAVDRAGLAVAKEKSYRATGDRRLFYQRTGVMAEDNTLLVRHELDPRNMTDEELAEWIEAGGEEVVDGEFSEQDGGTD